MSSVTQLDHAAPVPTDPGAQDDRVSFTVNGVPVTVGAHHPHLLSALAGFNIGVELAQATVVVGALVIAAMLKDRKSVV